MCEVKFIRPGAPAAKRTKPSQKMTLRPAKENKELYVQYQALRYAYYWRLRLDALHIVYAASFTNARGLVVHQVWDRASGKGASPTAMPAALRRPWSLSMRFSSLRAACCVCAQAQTFQSQDTPTKPQQPCQPALHSASHRSAQRIRHGMTNPSTFFGAHAAAEMAVSAALLMARQLRYVKVQSRHVPLSVYINTRLPQQSRQHQQSRQQHHGQPLQHQRVQQRRSKRRLWLAQYQLTCLREPRGPWLSSQGQ